MKKEIKIKDIKTEKNINSKKKYITLAIAVLVIAFAIIKANSGKDEATIQTQATSETVSKQAVVAEEATVGRIDISTKLVDASKPQFEVYVDGSETPEEQAKWMPYHNIQGYVIQNEDNDANIVIKVIENAKIALQLRGKDERDNNNMIIENWVKYTSLSIDGEEILPEAVEAWHNKPFTYTINAKAGEKYKIHVEWTNSDK